MWEPAEALWLMAAEGKEGNTHALDDEERPKRGWERSAASRTLIGRRR